MLIADCSAEANEILCNSLICVAGFESIKEIVNLVGIEQISKKLDSLMVFSSKYTGKKRSIIESNIDALKNNNESDESNLSDNIKLW